MLARYHAIGSTVLIRVYIYSVKTASPRTYPPQLYSAFLCIIVSPLPLLYYAVSAHARHLGMDTFLNRVTLCRCISLIENNPFTLLDMKRSPYIRLTTSASD